MSEVVSPTYTVGEEFFLSLAPIPAKSTLPADPIQWAVDNPALATLDTSATPPTVTFEAAGSLTITGTDGDITATLVVAIQPLAATGANIVLTPVTPPAQDAPAA